MISIDFFKKLIFIKNKFILNVNYSKIGMEIILRSKDAIVIIDEYGIIELFNPSAEHLFLYREKEVIGQNISMLMPDPFRGEHDSYLDNYKKTGKSKVLGILRELPAIKKDGAKIFIELSANKLIINGKLKFVGFIRDITERIKLYEINLKLKSEIEDLYYNAPCGYHMLDKNGIFQMINDTELSWLGYDKSEIVGKIQFTSILSDNSKLLFNKYFEEIKKKILIQNIELEFLNRENKNFIGLVSTSPVLDNDQNLLGIRSIVIDITDYKRIEKISLEVQEASKIKSEFLASISHELRTPLNIINGMAQILLDTPVNQEQKNYIQTFERASNCLLEIVNDLLDMSKIEAGMLSICPKKISLKVLVEDLIQFYKPKATAKKIILKHFIHPNIPEFLEIDESRLKQIFNNLIGNALKFTSDGCVTLSIELNHNPSRIGLVLFKIKDTGIGISKADQTKLFKPFTQANYEINRAYGGTGLGLVICEKIVCAHGGEIWLDSILGQGTSVYFTLSEIKMNPSFPASFKKSSDSKYRTFFEEINKNKNLNKKKLIMVVDDCVENRFVINGFFKNMPWELVEAENGQVALNYFKNRKFDLILMDMQMPVLDGYKATRIIREWEKTYKIEKTPIIALTGYAFNEEKTKCLNSGCDLHLVKPIRKSDLISIVEDIFCKN